MRHSFLFAFFLAASCLFLGAMEIEFSAGVDNMNLHKIDNSSQLETFPFVLGTASAKNEIVKNVGFKTAFSRDAIMQNSVSGTLIANSDYFNMEFGPFLGIIDNSQKLDFGIMGKIQIEYPGIVFLSFSGGASFGSQYDFLDSSDREKAEITLGFWLPHIIPSITVTSKKFTNNTEDFAEETKLLRLLGSLDFFGKTIPLTLRIDAGYEILNFLHNDNNSELSGELSAVFAGLEAKWKIAPQFSLVAGFEMPIVFWAEGNMKKPANLFELYKFSAGTVITLEN